MTFLLKLWHAYWLAVRTPMSEEERTEWNKYQAP
jgi:hypothetical protein